MAAQTATLTTASPTQVVTLTSQISIMAISGSPQGGDISILAGHSAVSLAPLNFDNSLSKKQPIGVFSISIPSGWVISFTLIGAGAGASVTIAME